MLLLIIVHILIRLGLVAALPQQRSPPGCSKRYLIDGVTKYVFNLRSSNMQRSYSFHLPLDYNQNRNHRYPVVIGFHGSDTNSLLFELDTKLSQERFSGDKIMVYPNGLGGSWAGPTYHTETTVEEDVRFVQDVLKDLEHRACIDTTRVYATGMSNGGGFVGTIACHPVGSKLFAAFAIGSGAFYTDMNSEEDCKPAYSPIPILEVHGADDKVVKYNGGQGEGGPLPPIRTWLDWWAERNDCVSPTEETSHDGTVHQFSWSCGGTDALIQHYRVDNMGHCWADSEINFSQLSVPEGPAPIQASKLVMQFFDRFGGRV